MKRLPYDTLSSQVDIAVARFNGDTDTFIGENLPCAGYAYQPQIHFMDGHMSIAWMDENNSLWSCTYNGSGWTDVAQGAVDWYEYETALPSTYTDEAPYTSSLLQMFSTSDYQAILYTAENTAGISNVYGLFNDGFGWGEPLQLTKVSNGSIGGFSAVISGDNMIRILANKIHYDANGAYLSADLDLYEKLLSADLTVAAADYVRDTLVPGGTLTLNVDVTNNSAETISGLTVHISSDGISASSDRAVTLLPGQTKTVYTNCELPNNYSRNFSITVEPQGEADIDLSDNTTTCALQMTDISLEKVFAEQTEQGINLTSMVVNRGSTDVQGYIVTYHIGEPDGEIIGSEYIDAVLLPGNAVYSNTVIDTQIELGTMVYAEVTMIAETEENLYGNNSSQTMVLQLGQDSGGESISVMSWTTGEGTTCVELDDPASLLTSESKIFAANYIGGKMTDIVNGVWSNDTVTFSKELSKGWTIFLLDANNAPLCSQLKLSY